MVIYVPQNDQGRGPGAPAPYDPTAPAYDQLTILTNQTYWITWSKTPWASKTWIINGLQAVHDQLAASKNKRQLMAITAELKPYADAGTPPPQALADRLQAVTARVQAEAGHHATPPPRGRH